MNNPEKFIIVIFGGSGDLTKRKLMPSLFSLYTKNQLADNFAVIGVGRSSYSDESYRQTMTEAISSFRMLSLEEKEKLNHFLRHVYYQIVDSTNPENYQSLKNRLTEIDSSVQSGGNYVYYLSTSPSLFQVIAENIGNVQLNQEGNGHGWKRFVVEKPFGYDLTSAQELNRQIQRVFKEEQIYRIDHYLGKETVQNLLAFRFANGMFEPLWNQNYIHHVEVTAAESIGVEDRGLYYDGAGAMRDMVQNHLLQVVAAVAMEPPSKFGPIAVRNEKVKVFESLRPVDIEKIEDYIVRGQYSESVVRGKAISGYRCEKNVKPSSRTETFVAMKIFIDNWRWGNVPFYIRTGKRMPARITEVVIHFKKTPHRLFHDANTSDHEENKLIIRIQPNEGILLRFGMKVPGAGFQIRNVDMDFHYADLADIKIPESYERLLLDCINGDATLYARADAVEACWSFITPILNAWKKNRNIKLYNYPAGSWGPQKACELFELSEDWHYPCKDSVDEGKYGEI